MWNKYPWEQRIELSGERRWQVDRGGRVFPRVHELKWLRWQAGQTVAVGRSGEPLAFLTWLPGCWGCRPFCLIPLVAAETEHLNKQMLFLDGRGSAFCGIFPLCDSFMKPTYESLGFFWVKFWFKTRKYVIQRRTLWSWRLHKTVFLT
jgi:hypothetical protein